MDLWCCKRMRLCTTHYEKHMQKFFFQLGYSIGRHPWRYIFGLLLITTISSLGFLRFNQINNARVTFTASDSPSHLEGKVMEKFLQQHGELHMVEVMIQSNDNGSLLREQYREQLWDLAYEINHNITIKGQNDTELTYQDMCEPYCMKNDAFFALLKMYDQNFSRIELTYPNMDILGKQIFIANNIYGVTFDGQSNNIKGFNTVILHYFLVQPTTKPMLEWESKLVHLLYDSHKYPLLKASAGSDNLVAEEVKKMGSKTAPMLSIALAMLMLFLVINSFRYKRRESKPLEAMLGAMTPILAGVTTIGMVSATAFPFQSIVVSVMFLVLAIGIDDVFIMLAAWHRTEKNMDIARRVAETVQVSGCSMTVTSITNLISFGNGVFSTTPVLQTFAIYASVASVVCYVYQLILFPAVLALTAHSEYKKNDDCSPSCLPEEIKPIAYLSKWHDIIWKWLAKIVCMPWTRVITFLILVVYWCFSAYGISIVKTELTVQTLAPPDARIVQFKVEYDKTIKMMQTVAIVVTSPGDLRKQSQLDEVQSMIKAYETASYSYGPDSTFCFLKPYLDYLQFHSDVEDEDASVAFSYALLPEFLESDVAYKATLRMNQTACKANEPTCIDSFIFSTGFTTLVKYNEMYPLLVEWRAINAKYPSLGVYAYSERSAFADQSNDLGAVIWQTLLSEVICMAISFVIFIPDVVSIFSAMFSLLSVNLGVFGMLSLWGVGVDPISMASLLMSIGFSVDISAHISYHYYEVKADTPRAKLEDAFMNIGWATVQGGLSTMTALLPILVKPSYFGLVFLKTIVLVTIFGLLHGLVVLPVFLSMLTSITDKCRRKNAVTSSSEDSAPTNVKTEKIEPHRISIKSVLNVKV